MTAPKAFISYSWSNQKHEDWVLDLATELRGSGIDVILDKWDLKEGNEANAFMEKMVSDPNIKKVIIVSDKIYAEKSNLRKGGAGTEAQIISKEIYDKEDQSKFVALVTEYDENNIPYLPIFYTSRIYIDFSDAGKFSTSFEQLLRWAADKPLRRKPELGSLPKFITSSEDNIQLATGTVKRRAIDAIKNGTPIALAATTEYFEQFHAELEKFRFPNTLDPASEEVATNIGDFQPYRDEILEIVLSIARYTANEGWSQALHRFFESLLSYFEPEMGVRYQDISFDNFKFFAHELFLHSQAIFLSENRPDLFNELIEKPYYSAIHAERGTDPIRTFTVFRNYLGLFAIRNEKLESRRISLVADFLHDRSTTSGNSFNNIMQVDFLLFVRSALATQTRHGDWFPDSLIYLERGMHTFEIFERSRSAKYFEEVRPFLANSSKQDLENLVSLFSEDPNLLPSWRHTWTRLQPSRLLGIEKLCTLP